jgi:flagellar biosynthetic protein FlhB
LAEDSDLEKTESASPRRLEKAREAGDVPRSRELATFAVLAAAALGFWASGEAMATQLKHLLRQSLNFRLDQVLDPAQFGMDTAQRLSDLLLAFLPLAGLLLLAAVASPLLIGGWLFHAGSCAPDFGRLNPLRGLGNMLSLRSLSELFKAVAKTLLVGLCAWFMIRLEIDSVLGLATQTPFTAIAHLAHLLLLGFAVLVAALALIALFDAPYQVWSYGRKLRMTRQELRDEAKETEGNPEIKAKIRAQQRAMARRRMMAQVPSADVVVTNPTHYAVALKYPEDANHAPLVVAKGADEVAARIRAIAADSGVTQLEAAPLARALYRHTELGDEIPPALYTAVAQVLAYVFQLRAWRTQGGPPPVPPTPMALPPGMDPLEAGASA